MPLTNRAEVDASRMASSGASHSRSQPPGSLQRKDTLIRGERGRVFMRRRAPRPSAAWRTPNWRARRIEPRGRACLDASPAPRARLPGSSRSPGYDDARWRRYLTLLGRGTGRTLPESGSVTEIWTSQPSAISTARPANSATRSFERPHRGRGKRVLPRWQWSIAPPRGAGGRKASISLRTARSSAKSRRPSASCSRPSGTGFRRPRHRRHPTENIVELLLADADVLSS